MTEQNAFEQTLEIRDRHTVVGHGHALSIGGTQAGQHVAARDNAAAALNQYLIGRQISREVLADGDVNRELLAGLFTEPARNLDAADVIFLGVVAAGFAD